MRHGILLGCLLLGLSGCGGEVVELRFARDSNANGSYLCQPSAGPEFACKSGQAFHQFDRVEEVKEDCPYGVASVYVETSSSGKVTRMQYACATPKVVDDFPPDTAPQPASSVRSATTALPAQPPSPRSP